MYSSLFQMEPYSHVHVCVIFRLRYIQHTLVNIRSYQLSIHKRLSALRFSLSYFSPILLNSGNREHFFTVMVFMNPTPVRARRSSSRQSMVNELMVIISSLSTCAKEYKKYTKRVFAERTVS